MNSKIPSINEVTIRLEASREALHQESQRRATIREIFTPFYESQCSLCDQCLDDPQITLDQARNQLLTALGQTTLKEEMSQSNAPAIIVHDQQDKFRSGAENAFLCAVYLA